MVSSHVGWLPWRRLVWRDVLRRRQRPWNVPTSVMGATDSSSVVVGPCWSQVILRLNKHQFYVTYYYITCTFERNLSENGCIVKMDVLHLKGTSPSENSTRIFQNLRSIRYCDGFSCREPTPPCGHLASGCRGGQHRGWRRWAVQSVDPLGGKGWCYTICHNNTDTCTSRYDASIYIYIRNYLKYWKIYRLYRYILYQKLLEIWNIYRYMWYIYIYTVIRTNVCRRVFLAYCIRIAWNPPHNLGM